MRKALFWIVLIVLGLCLAGLANSDYHVPIDAQFALFWPNPENGAVTLTYRSVRLVDGVTGYRAASGAVVGQTERGYFIADSDGTVRDYASRGEWAAEVEGRFPNLDTDLIAPSRLDDPDWRKVAATVSIVLILWIAVGFWIAWRSSRQPAQRGREMHACGDDEAGMDDIFAKRNAHRRQLLEQLATMPAREITGVVDAGAPGGIKNESGTWDFQLDFAAWRVGSDPIRREELRVTRVTASREEFESLWNAITPDSIVRLRARLGLDLDGKPAALLEEFFGSCDCEPELNAERERLLKPVIFNDPELGEFRLDRRLRSFVGHLMWKSIPVELSLDASARADAATALAHARQLWASQDEWNQRTKDAAVKALLAIKNESWLDAGESGVTDEDFKARMVIESVVVCPDGTFTFWYNDGGLFWDHAITVRGTLQDGPTDVDIAG